MSAVAKAVCQKIRPINVRTVAEKNSMVDMGLLLASWGFMILAGIAENL